jgi:cytochrome c peroxidase
MRTPIAVLLFGFAVCAQAQTPIAFTQEERAKILRHGPWPPAAPRDASNPVSGRPAAIALGERLFFEPRLSGTGSVLCATCHVPYRGFQDGRARAFGLEETERNTPTLLDVGFYRRYGWEGARDTLWSQSIRPLLEPREMKASAAHVAGTMRKLYEAEYARAFERPLPASDDAVLADVGKALAAYQETLVSGRTPFDEFRDALASDDVAVMKNYPVSAQRGLRIFIGGGGCSGCHAGPNFSDGRIVGGFRVPGLRNVSRTAPYLHDGSLATLREVMTRHSDLSESEIDDVVSFLESLKSL